MQLDSNVIYMSDRSARKDTKSNPFIGYSGMLGIDSNLNKKDSNTINMDKNTIKDNLRDSNKSDFERINIFITRENADFLREYKKETGAMPATKCSELLNKAIIELKKDWKKQ